MRARKMGQVAVAEAIGVSQATVSRYLDDRPDRNQKPGYDEIKRLAELFEVPPGFFFETTDEPKVVKEGPAAGAIDEALADAEEIRLKTMALQVKLRKLKR